MKKCLLFLVLLIISIPLHAVVIDKIVATVNGEPVTLSELERILQPVYIRYEQVLKGEELEQYKVRARRELLEQLIENKLILQEAKEEGVAITEAALEEQLAEVKDKFGSMEEFVEALKREGLDLGQYKKELGDQLTTRAMIERDVVPKAKVSPQEVVTYYEEYQDEFQAPEEVYLQHILVKDSREKIEEVYKQLLEGDDLNDQWVDLGFVPKNRLKPELLSIVETLEVGKHSEIIETEVGYYIILLKDTRAPRVLKLSEVWDVLEDKLFKTKLKKEHTKWIESLKSKSHIEISE